MSEVNAQTCEWCGEAILVDHEEHVTDSRGNAYHVWCREDEQAEAASWRREDAAIEEDIEEEV